MPYRITPEKWRNMTLLERLRGPANFRAKDTMVAAAKEIERLRKSLETVKYEILDRKESAAAGFTSIELTGSDTGDMLIAFIDRILA